MDPSPATQALLEKMRIEQRRLQHKIYSPERATQPGLFDSAAPSEQNAPPPPRPPPPPKQPEDTAASVSPTRAENALRMEIQSLHERIHALETSLHAERERHQQTRELLRLALKPPPEEAELYSPLRTPRSGVPVDGPPPAALGSMLMLAASGNTPLQHGADRAFGPGGVIGGSNLGVTAHSDRYEVYGPMAPSRVAQMIYDRAHQLEHNPSTSRQVLAQTQQHLSHVAANSGAAGGGGGGGSGGPNGLGTPLHGGGFADGLASKLLSMADPTGSGLRGGAGGGGSSTPGRNQTPLRRAGTPTPSRGLLPQARPFGIGEARFVPIAVVGETATYRSHHQLVESVSTKPPGGAGTSPSSRATTPRRTMLRSSPAQAVTLRSPAHHYGSSAL